MLYVYALLLLLFVKKEGLILRMRERRFWVLFLLDLERFWVSCLHTLLRDQNSM